MAERSVSNIRAMFEAKETSPPSRGRSPAGSERSAGSRNISSIRSSFVAVEKSGQTGPMLGLRRVSDVTSGSPAALDRLKPTDVTSPPLLATSNPLSRSSSLSKVQEEDGDLGTILKGSPFQERSRLGSKSSASKTELQGPPITRLAKEAAGTMAKYQAGLKKKEESSSQSTTAPKPAPIVTKVASQDKTGARASKTPTSAARAGPAVKVSSPRTSTAAAAAAATTTASTSAAPITSAKATPPKKVEPKLSAKSSRASLSTTAPAASSSSQQAPRGKSPIRPTPTQARKPARQSDVSTVKKPSRPSVGAADPEFLNRLTRPTQSSSGRVEKDEKAEEKWPSRPSIARPADGSFLERMSRPTQASASKHQDDQAEAKSAAQKVAAARPDSKFLERMMKPTASSASKHESEEVKEEKPRTSTSKALDNNFLERLTKPTASSSIRTSNEPHTETHGHSTSPPPQKPGASRAPDSGFLDRLTKATASSSSRTANEPHVEPHTHASPAQPKSTSTYAPEPGFLDRLTKPTASSTIRNGNEAHAEPHAHAASPKQTKVAPAAKVPRKVEAPKFDVKKAATTGKSGPVPSTEPEAAVQTSLANESAAPRPELIVKATSQTEPKPDLAPVPVVPVEINGEAKAVDVKLEPVSEKAEPVSETTNAMSEERGPDAAPAAKTESKAKSTLETGSASAIARAEAPNNAEPRHEPVQLTSAPEKPAESSAKEEKTTSTTAEMFKAATQVSEPAPPAAEPEKDAAEKEPASGTGVIAAPASVAAKTEVKLGDLMGSEEASKPAEGDVEEAQKDVAEIAEAPKGHGNDVSASAPAATVAETASESAVTEP